MRKFSLAPVLLAGLFIVAPARAQAPASVDLSGTWKFAKGDNKAWAATTFDDALWKDIQAPASWQSQGNADLTGFAWYRKHVSLPVEWGRNPLVTEGKILKMDLGVISDAYEVYWNGGVIAQGGKLPPTFAAAGPTELHVGVPADRSNFGGDNVLAVRVYDKDAPGGILSGALAIRQPTFADFLAVGVSGTDNRTEFKKDEGLPFEVAVENSGPAAWQKGTVKITVADGAGRPLVSAPVTVDVGAASGNKVSVHRTAMQLKESDIVPGIYTVTADAQMNGQTLQSVSRSFVYAPLLIRSQTFRTQDQLNTLKPKIDQFWRTTVSALKNTPLNATASANEARSNARVKVYKVQFNALRGQPIFGWLAVPANVSKAPGVVVMPGYGNGKIDPPVFLAENGFAALAINVHGSDVDAVQYPSEADAYGRGGVNDPNTFVMRNMVAAGLRAVDFLAQRPDVDAEHLGVIGASQGGGLAVNIAALDPRVKVIVANSPVADFNRMFATARQNPASALVDALDPGARGELTTTMSYFDPTVLAERVRVPVLITLGMRDAVTPPETAYSLKNAFPQNLAVRIVADESTGHTVTGLQMQESLAWLKKFLVV